MSKHILLGQKSRGTLALGASELARAVGVTYGPHGGKVAISKLGTVVVTMDGSSIAQECQFKDLRRLGASLLRSASSATDKDVGDGSTTTILLAESILSHSLTYTHKWDPVSIRDEIISAASVVRDSIRDSTVTGTRDDVLRVGEMASHGDLAIANTLFEAIQYVGESGTILLTKGDRVDPTVEKQPGVVLGGGWVSDIFSNDSPERILEGPLVAIFATPLWEFEDVRSLAEESSQWPGRGLVIFAPKIGGQALATLGLNNKKGVLSSVVIGYKGKPHEFREWSEDLASITNGVVVDTSCGMDHKKFDPQWLGSARRITVTRDKTTIQAYEEEVFQQRRSQRIAQLEAYRKNLPDEYAYDRDRVLERIGALDGGLCRVGVGGMTESEAQDRRSRAEDALQAMKSCLGGGVAPGAGMAFLAASYRLPDTLGGLVLSEALREPLKVLVRRAGGEVGVVMTEAGRVLQSDPSGWTGWDPTTKAWRNFRDQPRVVDSTKVLLRAFDSAISVACQILSTGSVLVNA